jgi:hypothetical protein
MHTSRLSIVIVIASCLGASAAAQPSTPVLGPEEAYFWNIRASHADEILIAVGDSLDIVLLRARCGADAGHGQKGCWDASTVTVRPQWMVEPRGVARVRALRHGEWRFGRGAAGARLYGLSPGLAVIIATIDGGETALDSLRVISAPGAVRVVLESMPRVVVAGDTVRFRLTARDSRNRTVAVLTLPLGWNVVGPPDDKGYTPVAFHPWGPGGWLVARLGRMTDSLQIHPKTPLRRP